MQVTNQEAEQLLREGVAALQAGHAAEARAKLERMTGSGIETAELWMLSATACRMLGDEAGEEAALDRLLAIEPRAVRAIILKADCRLRAGDQSGAAMLYRKSLVVASGGTVPQHLIPDLERAEAAMEQLKARYTDHIDRSLTGRGFPEDRRSPRFQQSLDLRADRKQLFLQEPTEYFFPAQPHIQFFDREDFAWAPAVETAADAVRGELEGIVSAGMEGFRPYIRTEANLPRDHPLLDKPDWSALFFCENGEMFEEVIARCPRTWEALQKVPLPRIDKSGPTVMFSLLRPGTRIPPHHGTHNTRLICHLPLIVPPGCGFRVGNEVREWEVGKLIIFDDTIEHEAWNDSGEDRVVLIFDIWRPELTEREQREVAAFLTIPGIQAGAGA